MKIYTLEAYAPPFPHGGRFVRALCGDFEKVRERLSPDMLETKEIIVLNKCQADRAGRLWAKHLAINNNKKYKFRS